MAEEFGSFWYKNGKNNQLCKECDKAKCFSAKSAFFANCRALALFSFSRRKKRIKNKYDK